ncbi:unnamed protein product [Orchesella dallaii]|uniref:Transcriptional regulator ATRX n=1 Tax=Orchesella dallaii TaxID=48710 RepID=A0ABP1QAT6_9HEXA
MPLLRNRKKGAAEAETTDAPVNTMAKASSSVSEESAEHTRDEDLSLLSWLEFHQREAESSAEILKDELNTIKKRKIMSNIKVLENERGPEAIRLSKSIVTGFIDAISKAVKNFQTLNQTMVDELQQRYNLPDKWLDTASVLPSVAGSEIIGPTFSRNYLQHKFMSSLDDGSKSNDAFDAKDIATSNDSDEQVETTQQNVPNSKASGSGNDGCTSENDVASTSKQADAEIGPRTDEEDVDMIPASDDEEQLRLKNHEENDLEKVSPNDEVILKTNIKKEKIEEHNRKVQEDQRKTNFSNSKNAILKVAKKEAMENSSSGSDTDVSDKTCVVPSRNLSQSDKTSPAPGTSRVKKEPSEKTPEKKKVEGLEKKKTTKNSPKNIRTPTRNKEPTIEHDNSDDDLDSEVPLVTTHDETTPVNVPDNLSAINGIDELLQVQNDDLMDFISTAVDMDDTMTVMLSRSSDKINVDMEETISISEPTEDVQKTDEGAVRKKELEKADGRKFCNGEDSVIAAKDGEEKSKKRQERRNREELRAMREVLGSSDSDSDSQSTSKRKREAPKKKEKDIEVTAGTRQGSKLASWKDDPKLKQMKAVVELEKLDPSVEKTLNEHKFVCLKSYQKMKKTNLETLEKHDSFSDDDSVASDDSLVKLTKALKSLTRNSLIRTKQYKQKESIKKKVKKSKHKSSHENESDNESLLDDDEDDDCNDVKFKPTNTSFKRCEDDLNSCSESEDLSPGSDMEKEKGARKSQRSTRSSAADSSKKKYAKATIDSSSNSEGEDKKLVLGSDSESDSIKKKSAKRDKKKAQSSDSDSDFTVVKKKGTKGAIKKESDSDASHISLSDGSDDDSDFKDPAPKRFRSSSKRNRDSSSEGGKKKKRRRKRIVENNSEDDSDKKQSDDSDIQEVSDDEQGSSQKGRKNIRKIMSNKKLAKTTKEAEKEEEERRKRLSEKQALFNGIHKAPESDKLERLVLDVDPETKEAIIEVDPTIVRHLKPHQAEGIKFMYNACFESVEMIKQNKVPGGCILAHCMGLGKTLQSVAFIHTLLTNKLTGIKTALIICPLSTVNNWFNEFKSWTEEADDVRLHKLYEAKNSVGSRIDYLKTWQRRGGVGILHYDMFRMLADPKGKKKMKESFRKLIKETLLNEPGPDIVICDEGHLLKNCKSMLSLAVNSIGTHRRVVLTGTPLQNNLVEYHTMMSFVKPNLLGTLNEFTNRFVNPIKNGQHADSTESDVKTMKRRAHVLHGKLEGCVQRRDYLILAPYLPPKYEYIINIKLSDKQELLYKHYLENVVDSDLTARRRNLLKYYAELVKIWSHPIALTMSRAKTEDSEDSDEAGSLKDFVVDTDEEESKSSDSGAVSGDEQMPSSKRKTRAQAAVDPDPPLIADVSEVERLADKWWNVIFKSKNEMTDIDISGKLVVLQQILKTCESIGDKVLVFSQYLSSLDIIEEFLDDWDKQAVLEAKDRELTFPLSEENLRWRRNIEYFRIDGQTKVSDRHRDCEKFNRKSGQMTKAKLFLISTRAGGLGINLYGANRVVIFDASWNPSQDMQSIFRVYRFGQDKPCYIYRMIARGTMEEKILRRQITKLSLSSRVVDEHQIERHFKFDDVNEMYRYDEEDESARQTLAVPKDRILADLLISHEEWIRSYEEFDSLLENKPDEGLTNEEKAIAWEEYRRESDRRQHSSSGPENAETFLKVRYRLLEKFPTATDQQLREAADMGLVVIEKIRTLMMHVNKIETGVAPGDVGYINSAYLEPLKNWLSNLLTPPPAGTPLPQIDETTPLAPPLPVDIRFTQFIAPQNRQFQQFPPQVNNRPSILQHNRARPMMYPRPTLPSMNVMQNNFRNIAHSTVNGPVNRPFNMIRPPNVPRTLPRDPLL